MGVMHFQCCRRTPVQKYGHSPTGIIVCRSYDAFDVSLPSSTECGLVSCFGLP